MAAPAMLYDVDTGPMVAMRSLVVMLLFDVDPGPMVTLRSLVVMLYDNPARHRILDWTMVDGDSLQTLDELPGPHVLDPVATDPRHHDPVSNGLVDRATANVDDKPPWPLAAVDHDNNDTAHKIDHKFV